MSKVSEEEKYKLETYKNIRKEFIKSIISIIENNNDLSTYILNTIKNTTEYMYIYVTIINLLVYKYFNTNPNVSGIGLLFEKFQDYLDDIFPCNFYDIKFNENGKMKDYQIYIIKSDIVTNVNYIAIKISKSR